jgi:hypothetical protein
MWLISNSRGGSSPAACMATGICRSWDRSIIKPWSMSGCCVPKMFGTLQYLEVQQDTQRKSMNKMHKLSNVTRKSPSRSSITGRRQTPESDPTWTGLHVQHMLGRFARHLVIFQFFLIPCAYFFTRLMLLSIVLLTIYWTKHLLMIGQCKAGGKDLWWGCVKASTVLFTVINYRWSLRLNVRYLTCAQRSNGYELWNTVDFRE